MISREFNTLQIQRSPSNIGFVTNCIDAKKCQKCYNNLTMTYKVKRYKLTNLASMRFSAEDIR